MNSNLKKKLLRIGLIVLGLVTAIVVFLYNVNVSEGVRSGVVMKISKKGMLIKTWEGQLNTGSIASGSAASPAGVWEFSVPRDDDKLYEELEQVSLSGERVKLRYKEKMLRFSWRGDTKYFVYDVERVKQGE